MPLVLKEVSNATTILKTCRKNPIHMSVWGVRGKAASLHLPWQFCLAQKKGLLQRPLCSLHPKLSERDKIKKSCFLEEAVQFLTLLRNPRYSGKAQGSFIAVLQPCRPVANCVICVKGDMALEKTVFTFLFENQFSYELEEESIISTCLLKYEI